MSPLRILLVDDHEVVRQGLWTILEKHAGWEVCGEAATGFEAIEKARSLKPDIVVLDFSMPELNGLEVTRRIHKLLPRTEILILTVYDSDRLASEFLAAGARGYVLKGDAGKLIHEAVECLARHKPFLTPRVSERIVFSMLGPPAPGMKGDGCPLTAREREVLRLVAEGKISKEIAGHLQISVNTVETHRNNIMHKLGVHTVGELIRYAIRNGLTET